MPSEPALIKSSAPVRRLLVRGVNWLGDAVMTTPALQRLRERFPEARIALLTPGKLEQLWQQHPSVDEVISFSPGESVWSVGRRLKQASFDLALVLPNSPRSALETWLAGIPIRVGYARPWRNWFLTRPVPGRPGQKPTRKLSVREVKRQLGPRGRRRQRATATENVVPGTGSASAGAEMAAPGQVHQIFDYLHLAAQLGADAAPVAPLLRVTEGELEAGRQALLAELGQRPGGSSNDPPLFLGVNASAAYGPAKRWPAQNFAAVMRAVGRSHGHAVWLAFGEAKDTKLCEDIARQTGGQVLNLAGKTSLRELMSRLKLCRVLLTNDSGPMHLAAALGTTVVAPFGSTSADLTGPGLPEDPHHHILQSGVPCAPCFRRDCPVDFRCMTSITVEKVTTAVLSVLERDPGSPPTASNFK
jgi:heptosyltransferase-2